MARLLVYSSLQPIKTKNMKKLLHFVLTLFCLGFVLQSFAQEKSKFDEQFKIIDTELTSWDPVRGKWLSSSLRAMSSNQPIPDRTFPEDYSPGEMMKMVPPSTLSNIRTISQANGQNTTNMLERERWNRVNNYVYRPDCNLVMGRTYGDPHLKSFDGASYSFQTVGEFVLVNSNNGQMEVQVRQEPQRDDFSLNTAVAMRVGGDRVGIYANQRDINSPSPIMVNGFPVQMTGRTYYLPHGGTIRNSGRDYIITWPSGEKVSVDLRNSGGMSFMNIAVQVYPCTSNNMSGLLGNANGTRQDDFNIRGRGSSPMFGGEMSERMEKERLAFLAKDFANNFRIQPMTSLFDYGFGQSTMSYTDYTYPRVHHTLNDLSRDQRTNARNACARAGLTGAELDACIFDQGFLRIDPTPRPVIPCPTTGATLGRVDNEEPNVNPRDIINTGSTTTPNGTGAGIPTSRPITSTPVINERETPATTVPSTRPDKPAWQSSDVRDTPTPGTPSTGTSNDKIEKHDTNSNGGAIPRPSDSSPNTEKKDTKKDTRTEPVKTNPRPTYTPKPRPVEKSEPEPSYTPPPRKESKPTPPPASRPVSKPTPKPKPVPKPTPNRTKSAPVPTPAPSRGGRGG